ncbi:MAG: hypothetical protein QNJ16_19030 [Rhodobacter sp.]|nr:hypothetical protein [Rhodobacter sp.]
MTDRPYRLQNPETPIAALLAPVRPYLPKNREAAILATLLLFLTLWGLAIATFGYPALVWPMKAIVPGLVVCLILITMGK